MVTGSERVGGSNGDREGQRARGRTGGVGGHAMRLVACHAELSEPDDRASQPVWDR